MKTLFGTQVQWLTAVFIAMEIIFFFIQVYDLFRYPQRRRQWWDLGLLGLLILFNLANGLLPDLSLNLDLRLQYMIAYGFAFLVGGYFPLYFYKVFKLPGLRLYATWGVALFLFLPYLLFNVLWYAYNGKLIADQEWGVLIPGIYGLVILALMFKAIWLKDRGSHDKRRLFCELAVWLAIIPWEVSVVFAFYPVVQWLRITLANLGWVVIMLIKIEKAIRNARLEHGQLIEFRKAGSLHLVFDANCEKYKLSKREIEIVGLLRQGHTYKGIGKKLFLSEKTVDKHIQNIYVKTAVNSKIALIHKLYN